MGKESSRRDNTLNRLLEGLTRAAKGDITTRISITGMDKNMAELASAFNDVMRSFRNIKDEMRETQQRLEDLIKKQKKIFDASRDIILQVNRYGIVVEVNRGLKDVLGYDPDDVIGRHFAKSGVIPENALTKVTGRFKDAVASGKVIDTFELELNAADKTRYCMEASTKPIFDEERESIEGFVIIMRNITRRRRAEETVRNQERKLHSIISSIEDILFILDQDLRFVEYYQSPELPDLTIHLKPKDYIGRSIRDVFPRVAALDIEKAAKACIKTKDRLRLDYSWPLGDTIFWFSARITSILDKDGNIMGVTVVARDITRRINAEKALRESEKKYRNIFENSPQGFILLGSEGHILDVNKKICDWLGYKPEEIIGKDHILYPFLTKAGKITAMRKFMQRLSGKTLPAYRLEFVTKTNEVFLGEILAMPIRDDKGKAVEFLVMITPVQNP